MSGSEDKHLQFEWKRREAVILSNDGLLVSCVLWFDDGDGISYVCFALFGQRSSGAACSDHNSVSVSDC